MTGSTLGIVDRVNLFARRIPVWLVYGLVALPAPYLFYLAATGGLGVEPISALEHEYGELALKLLIAGLCITPLRRFLGVNLMKFRRAIGVMAFAYVFAHLGVWLFLDVQDWGRIWADIVKRPYITIGMVGFVLLVPLAVTSNNLSLRWLGPLWRKLHLLVFPAAILAGLHFVMLRKGVQIEPLLYLGTILALVGIRFRLRDGKIVRA